MADKQGVLETIYTAIDEMNMQLPEPKRLEKSPDTVILGKAGKLDSLGVVNFILLTEEYIEDEYGVMVSIADKAAASSENNPLRTIETMAEYIVEQMSSGA